MPDLVPAIGSMSNQGVFALGQGCGLAVYVRNLQLIRRQARGRIAD